VKGLKVKTTERGILLGKNLFGGEIEEEIEEISGKRVIGSVEKVKLIGKDGKEVIVEAKIDTGADSTSIDTDLARELGFGSLIDFFDSFPKPSVQNDTEAFLIQESLRKEYLGKHEDLKDIVFVSSSNGISFRPKIRCQLILDSIELNPKITIASRAHLQYPVIVGRNSLKRFLIDVNK
jgi:hypothetical protein